MRQWKTWAMWSALGALGLMVTSCWTPFDLTCSDDAQCLESEICHPDEGVCVQVCATVVVCPETAPSCEAISAENPTKICKCKKESCAPP